MNKHSKKDLLKRTVKLEKELAAKSYALKIESALEKVSIAAMSLRRSKDLSGISCLIFEELKKLGFTDLRNSEIIINNDAKETITSYYYSDYGVTGVIELDYKSNAIVKGWADQLKKASNAFAEVVIPEREMKAWRKYREEIGYLPDRKLNKAKTVYYYSYSTGTGALSISSFKPVSKEQIKILKRFRNVFNLSYQRYIDIVKAEAQAREAEIELALERVRAKTMTMQKSEELQETTLVLFQQFKSLGVPTPQVSICVFDEDTKMGEMFVTLKGEKIDRSFKMDLDKEVFVMKKAKKAFLDKQKKFSFIVKGKELQEYNHWRNSLIGKKGWDESNVVRKQSWYVNGVFFSRGLMGFSSDVPSTDETLKLLDRFAAVFDLTFTRFLDLQKAEAQAREAQIEAALERVRARTMAMHKSDDLLKVITHLSEQFQYLGFKVDVADFNIDYWEKDWNLWLWAKDVTYPHLVHVPYFNHPFFNTIRKNLDDGIDLSTAVFTKEEKDSFQRYMYEYVLTDVPEEIKKQVYSTKGFAWSVVFCKNTSLTIANFDAEPYSEEQNLILRRFANVFEQSYTRFLDLQKAEAQARKAEIELALERVRAKTMAMYKSTDLLDVINILSEQFQLLGFKVHSANFNTSYREKDWTLWLYNPGTPIYPEQIRIPYFDHPYFNRTLESIAKGSDFAAFVFTKEEKDSFLDHLYSTTIAKNAPDERKKLSYEAPGFAWSTVYLKNTALTIANYDAEPYTEEQNAIIRRFGNVFEQLYTRFLDLKKAEAQAREAQIEAALERVRSHAMAMQTSEELNALIGTVFTELTKLDLVLTRCVILIFEGNEKGVRWWMANSEAPSVPMNFFVKYADMPFFDEYLKGWQERLLKWQYILEGENKSNTDEFLFKETELSQLPDFVIAGMRAPVRVYLNASFNNFGNLTLASLEPLSDQHFDILLRFAKVFDLTYTRFNDLQQAEAQARESQIQLALERVRARTMAMQKSDELPEAANLLFQQVQSLRMPAWSAGYCIWDEDKKAVTLWMSSEGVLQPPFRAPLTEDPSFIHFSEAHERGETFFVDEIGGEELVRHYKYMRTLPVVGEILDSIIEAGHPLPTFQIFHLAYFSKGFLLFITYEQVPNAHDIFRRFAKVFDQTYTRFLDLQKAEAQAREAQIEAALERVRGKTMVMHSSQDVAETVAALFDEFVKLGIKTFRCGIGIMHQIKEMEVWTAKPNASGKAELFTGRLDMAMHPLLQGAYSAWEHKEKVYTYELKEDDLVTYFTGINKNPNYTQKYDISSLPPRLIHSEFYFPEGTLFTFSLERLSAETSKIFERFTTVFGQTYRRFLDLQKAEAQARESQIQLALERVRARTMAMHKSVELAETAQVLFHQLQELGGIPDRIAIGVADESEGVVNFWSTDQSGSHIDKSFKARLNERTVMSKTYQAWKDHKKSLVIDLHGDDVQEWIQFAREEMGVVVKDEFIKDRRVHNFVFFSHGWILVTTHEPQSAETIQILERFASVFSLTYRRFLDLQKAEAQAREAQIEAALERVRARSMAMHHSSELHDAADVLFQQLRLFGGNIMNAGIALCTQDADEDEYWLSSDDGHRPVISIPHTEDAIQKKLYEDWKNKSEFYSIAKGGDELRAHYNYMQSVPSLKPFFKEGPDWSFPTWQKWHTAYFSHGYLFMITLEPYEEEKILVRFARVFEQAYTRFLDLQKAEAQAREAQIEAALERVRSKAMAMHISEDLGETIRSFYQQMRLLGLTPKRCGVGILNAKERESNLTSMYTTEDGESVAVEGKLLLKGHSMLEGVYQHFLEQKEYYPVLRGNEIRDYYQLISPQISYPDNPQGEVQFGYFFFFPEGGVYAWTEKQMGESELNIYRRFTSVLSLTYKRYLDLQKAEAQAREAQIETSLERVRSKTMAMHNSNDVGETVAAMFAEFVYLGIHTNRCGILIFNDQHLTEVWTARSTPGGNAKLIIGKLDLDAHKMLRSVFNAWKAKETFYQYDLLDNDLVQYYTAINNSKFYPTQFDLNALPSKEFNSAFFFTDGGVFSFTNEPLAEEHAKIIKRFALVFGQTYRRYLDLQKAEAQARESQIQLSLERVRARTMAMHKSEELAEVAEVLYNQLKDLGDDPERITIGIMSEDNRVITWWATDQGGSKLNIRFQATADEPTVMLKLYNSWKAKHASLVVDLTGPELSQWVKYCREVIGVPINEEILQDRRVQTAGFFSRGCVMITSPHRPDAETINILERFTTVFDLTYRRFLDLQKAEAQAREAQIETSLERVRSKTMAMHNSDDVTSAIATMFTELDRLGIENMRCGIAHYLEDHKMEVWSVSNLADGKVVRGAGLLDTNSIPFWKIFYSTWQKKEDFLYYLMAGKEKEEYFKKISTLQNYLSQSIEDVPDLSIQTYYFPEGSVWAFSMKPHSEEDKQVMKRFASVFSLTFRRYQDLKKAEAQTREATIEAALEKVRGKAMAMHNSNDLSVTASLVFTELRKLGINPIRCGVGLLNKESQKAPLYSATSSPDGDSLSLVGWAILSEHPVLEKIYQSWMDNEEYYPELQGEQMRSYYQLLLRGLPVAVPDIDADKKQFGTFLPFSVGCLYAWSEAPYSEAEIKVLKRFATIIDLTFRRYIELQTSEANAREAVKQAALDRIRADIASMRTVADLDRITPLIWNELTILGLPFIRCGVFIMDSSQQLIHTFLSTPDGKAIGAFHLPYDTPGNFSVMLKHWLDKETYISRWDEVDFIGIAEILVQQGSIATKEQYLSSLPKGGFYLHFLPFLQGMLYVGNTTQLGEEEIELIQHVADAFSTAYARYEDFNRLEAAKQQVEKTLTDLKQAQTQLVQSEKMASLGELTAGIAHEIQNPLNFVNNFSDVSNELLDEMKEELAKGNIGDAIAIAEDVKQNLEKINHHGKRADGIVKGMLQHSRTSSGQKEMTNINALADEYLRLAYHGLRAKEKSFNAKFETSFDENVGEINIIPQDIGRVILNLINNAFYAVSERKKQGQDGYEPTVILTTVTDNGKIWIKVKDNGNGISQKVLDKIFQPFFTTKPTGQGTGLGLSLAYDIVKAHGGDIKVETKEGEGSEFVISLPLTKS